ncbi:SMI1/KNR4 family protein [Acidovorax sp. SUPP3434]|uniref:SMI1/KNR4 family protein n=1 Tax=Acidovorax sp. SUPP3434 TaxID=2920880 RepID=UPI0023DE33A8|nr:SMI1/KNR4 family protein [Acidovorax sp. SUPP3434]GKT02366.1 SMI1/KNR4 family protein [Acidovorax sp. SUPP3434]
MMVQVKNLGLSEQEIQDLDSKGFGLDKKQKKMMLEMYDTHPASAIDLNKLAADFNLPEDYRDFLLKNNGGIPIPNAIKTEGNIRVVNSLLALNAPSGFYDSIDNYLEIYKDRIPNNTLPIASAGSSDLILMKTDGVGGIYYWDHNFESDGDGVENYYENMEMLASNFSEFLDLFYQPED